MLQTCFDYLHLLNIFLEIFTLFEMLCVFSCMWFISPPQPAISSASNLYLKCYGDKWATSLFLCNSSYEIMHYFRLYKHLVSKACLGK